MGKEVLELSGSKMSNCLVQKRLALGWTLEKAMSYPIRKRVANGAGQTKRQ